MIRHMFVARLRKRYDWLAIRDFYERGRSAAECQREFGISNGAWHGAVQRGAVVLRPNPRGTPRTGTRAAIAELLSTGLTQAEIARKLGVSRPTVCFHVRRLGVPANSASRKRYDWGQIRAFYERGHSISSVAASLVSAATPGEPRCGEARSRSVLAWNHSPTSSPLGVRAHVNTSRRDCSPLPRRLCTATSVVSMSGSARLSRSSFTT